MRSREKLDYEQPTKTMLALYSTAFGLVASGGATAAPTSSEASFTLVADDGASYGIITFDIDGDEIDDFRLSASFRGNESSCEFPGSVFLSYEGYGGNVSYYAGLVAGDSVDSSLPGTGYYSSQELMNCNGPTGPYGEPSLSGDGQSARGYVGVRFLSGDNFHYGYLDIEVRQGSVIAELVGACFESESDTPLEVGAGTGACASPSNGDAVAPTAVPVGVGALPLGLGLLALGAGSLYRRKRLH